MKQPIPTEYQECVDLTHRLNTLVMEGKLLLFAHLVNELKLDRRRGQKPNFAYLNSRKAEGWKSGIPDYILVTKDRVIFLEMKRLKGSVTRPDQKEWLTKLDGKETKTLIAKGADEAMRLIEKEIK